MNRENRLNTSFDNACNALEEIVEEHNRMNIPAGVFFAYLDPPTALATLGLQGFLSEDVWGLIPSPEALQLPNNYPEDFKILAIADLIGNNPELKKIALEVYNGHVLNHVVQARVIEACGQIVCMYTYIVDPTDVEEGIKALMEAYPRIANRIEVAAYAGMLPAIYSGRRGKPSLASMHERAFKGTGREVICVPSTVPTAEKIVDIVQGIMQEHGDEVVCIFSGLGQVGSAVMRLLQQDRTLLQQIKAVFGHDIRREAVAGFVSALQQGPNRPPFIYGIEGGNLNVSELYTIITNIMRIERKKYPVFIITAASSFRQEVTTALCELVIRLLQNGIRCSWLADDYPRLPSLFATEVFTNAGVPPEEVLHHVEMKIIDEVEHELYGYSDNNTHGTQKRNKNTLWACEGGALNVLLELLGLKPVAK